MLSILSQEAASLWKEREKNMEGRVCTTLLGWGTKLFISQDGPTAEMALSTVISSTHAVWEGHPVLKKMQCVHFHVLIT